jgi:FMN-dependent NADH-azoreductase
MILYINCCVRGESRTDKIAIAVLDKLGGEYTELYLPDENLQPLSKERLEKRTALIEKGDYSDDMFRLAKQFAIAEKIVISAPFWDLSFPSILKLYIENIYVTGIVSEYNSDGTPHGLCRADEIIYVTTAGGPYVPDYSFGYIKDLAENYLGIEKATLIKAEMLDVEGFDAEKIIKKVISEL